MNTDIRDCEILYHVDMPLDKHADSADLARTAKIAGDNVYGHLSEFQPLGNLRLVVCLVRLPKAA